MAEEFIFQLRIEGPDKTETFTIPLGETLIGRQQGNPIHLNSPMVSRQHARLVADANLCQIVDLGSANGTLINGNKLEANVPTNLVNNDSIQIGPFVMTFEQIPIAAPEPKPKARPKPAEAKEKPAAKKEPESEKKAPAKAEKARSEPTPSEVTAPPSFVTRARPEPEYNKAPPGLSMTDSRYLDYLPGNFRSDFASRFLAMLEAILAPIEWNVDNFDLYLDPETAPEDFLPWLANWFDLGFDSTWDEEQRRLLLREAHEIYARRGTRYALSRLLEIYLGQKPEILDLQEDQAPFTFLVRLPVAESVVDRELVERLIDANKPAHTSYQLQFSNGRRKKA